MHTPGGILPTRRRAWAEIDLGCAEHNFKQIREKTRAKLCCVIKANAYGHGAVKLAELYQSFGADYLAVSNISEALQLRWHGISLPILILGYTDPSCAATLAEQNITQCVFSHAYGLRLSEEAARAEVQVKIHIKLDTGMGRIGFACRDAGDGDIDAIEATCCLPGLFAEGIFTHFATADGGEQGRAYVKAQLDHFLYTVDTLDGRGIRFRLRHVANSAAILDYPEAHLDMVRAGVVLYGLKPSEEVCRLPELKPLMRLCSLISHIKTVLPGQSISYGRTFTAEREMRVATVPIGYADGFFRGSGENGYRLSIKGHSVPIVGRVCMDQLMVDVTDLDCTVGDEVIVFGDSIATVDKLAACNGTIPYEVVCSIGERIPRAYVQDGRIVEWKDSILGR